MNTDNTAPIGIFDSGVGGLTVAKALHGLLPNESLIYIGDTKHTPWGDKSTQAIQTYSQRICECLLEKNCKLILIACHTASATAFEYIRTALHPDIALVNMIDPVLDYIQSNYQNQSIGLIGTKQTVSSNAYQNKLLATAHNITLKALATPLLCPLVEENLGLTHDLSKLIIQEYLSRQDLNNIQALILGCTHYPLLIPVIEDFYKNKNIDIIDPSYQAAIYVKNLLFQKQLVNPTQIPNTPEFYITDYNKFFEQTARLFFNRDIQLKPIIF